MLQQIQLSRIAKESPSKTQLEEERKMLEVRAVQDRNVEMEKRKQNKKLIDEKKLRALDMEQYLM